jgi:hypothetical protein
MKILDLFLSSEEDKEERQAKRVAKALKRGQEALLDKLEGKKDEAQGTLDRLVGGKVSEIDTENFNQRYQDASVAIILIDQQIKIAEGVMKDLYSNGKTK